METNRIEKLSLSFETTSRIDFRDKANLKGLVEFIYQCREDEYAAHIVARYIHTFIENAEVDGAVALETIDKFRQDSIGDLGDERPPLVW